MVKSKYIVKNYQQAELSKKIKNIIGRPSFYDYLRIINVNQLPDLPITREEIMEAAEIVGPSLGSLRKGD